jgi:murein L,D-transpeptidase YafK
MRKWTLLLIGILILGGSVYYYYPEAELPADKDIDKIVVLKSERIMNVYSGDEILKSYKISLGTNPLGDKKTQGDRRTPEGEYFVNDRNPNSAFHKNLGVSYPNRLDIEEAKRNGVDPGGEIKIHGIRNGFGFIGRFHTLFNWTAGCIAVTDSQIDELFEKVKIGTPIIIEP